MSCFDRGYTDYNWYDDLSDRKITFVARINKKGIQMGKEPARLPFSNRQRGGRWGAKLRL